MKQIDKQNYCPQTLNTIKMHLTELGFINFLSTDRNSKKFVPQLNYRDRSL